MLMSVVQYLEAADLKVSVRRNQRRDGHPYALLKVELDGIKRLFAVEVKGRSPYPSDIAAMESLRTELGQSGRPLLIAPYFSGSLGSLLSRSGWSWADATGNFDLRAPQFRAKQRINNKPPKRTNARLPGGTGALGIIRFLINDWENSQAIGHEELSQIAGVTQPRATQVLKQLREAGVVEGQGRNWFPDRGGLLEAFLQQYPGPGGSERGFFTLYPLLDAARKLTEWAENRGVDLRISADVGPDLVVPWRRPTHLVAYLAEPPTLSPFDWVESRGASDANIVLRVPTDASIFLSHGLKGTDDERIPLADTTQMIWDLRHLGGSDRNEAAENLSKWLLRK